MTMISDLPVNLVEEILCRVPLKSMRAVRLTCKEWEALSKSRSFSKMHIDKLSAGESMMVAWIDYNLYLMRVVLISHVFHCNGLLLCVLEDDATKVIVWNPYLDQTRSIESRYSHRTDVDIFSYALGYEDKGSSYMYYNARRNQFFWYEIYDFESSSWKTLDITPHWRILFGQHGVSLKGNTYWPASQRNMEEDMLDDHIICFNFSSESFGPLLRLPFDIGDSDYVTLSCVREEKLAVLLTHDEAGPMEFEIWITTKIEAEKVSWSKFLRVETLTGYYALIICDSFFIDEEKKVAMGFEDDYYKIFNIVGEDGYLKKLKLVECAAGKNVNCRVNACSYVPSLAQIKKPVSGGKGNNKAI
ncbi:hypothetical protein N665_0772s0008 [Sinapis alba]|nr:hypothetical protein N665_0772s0008 [Sinapis alba]